MWVEWVVDCILLLYVPGDSFWLLFFCVGGGDEWNVLSSCVSVCDTIWSGVRWGGFGGLICHSHRLIDLHSYFKKKSYFLWLSDHHYYGVRIFYIVATHSDPQPPPFVWWCAGVEWATSNTRMSVK